jgi:hypothetical protein
MSADDELVLVSVKTDGSTATCTVMTDAMVLGSLVADVLKKAL